MTLEQRLQLQIGRLVMEVLALEAENEQLRAAVPEPRKPKAAPETK